MKLVTIPLELARDIRDLLNTTIEYDSAGEPIDSDHAHFLNNLIDLDNAMKRAQ